MKSLLVFAAAVGVATSSPAFAYSVGLPLALPYAPLVHYSGCRNDAGALVPCAYGHPGPILTALAPAPVKAAPEVTPEESRKKRGAETEPFLFYSGFLPYAGYHTPLRYYNAPVVYSPAGCRNYLGSVVPCV